MIIGLTGLPASGKATVANILKNYADFKIYTFSSDILKPELNKSGIVNPTRDDYIKKALELRTQFGNGALAEIFIKQIKTSDPTLSQNYVIDGIRTVGEVNVIKNVGGVIFAIETPLKLRHEWILKRQKPMDNEITIEDLKKTDQKELFNIEKNKNDLNLAEVLKLADFTIHNNKTFNELEAQVYKALNSIK